MAKKSAKSNARKSATNGAKNKAAKTEKKTSARKDGEPRAGSKLEMIRDMLTSKKGTTTAQLLEALDWPAISVPEQAEKLGLKLRKEKVKPKDGRTHTVYYAA